MLGIVSRFWRHASTSVFCRPTIVASAALGIALAACTPSMRGGPDRIFEVSAEVDIARALAGPEYYAEYARASGPLRRQIRDQIVFARMYAADLFYSEYEASLTRERQNVGFFTTLASLALTASATAVVAAEAKTILAAVATGLTGAKEAYDKEILIEKTIAILQQQMRTRRNEVKVIILKRLAMDPSAYPLELALTDVESYYRAGTITGAFIDVSQATGVRLADARDQEEKVVLTRFAPVSDLGTRIRVLARKHSEAAFEYLRDNHDSMPLATFVIRGSRADQLKMIQYLEAIR
jgi:hypothetical protein